MTFFEIWPKLKTGAIFTRQMNPKYPSIWRTIKLYKKATWQLAFSGEWVICPLFVDDIDAENWVDYEPSCLKEI